MQTKILLFILMINSVNSVLAWSPDYEHEISAEREDNIKVAFFSGTGLSFTKKKYFDKVDITYDCSIGLKEDGFIDTFDQIHPENMGLLLVRNCNSITLGFKTSNSRSLNNLQIEVNNVNELRTTELRNACYKCELINFNISLSNIKFLNIREMPEFSGTTSLFITNVTIYESVNLLNMKTLYLHNVTLKTLTKNDIKSVRNPESIVIIKNSHFGRIETEALVFYGNHIEMVNSTFDYLEDDAFEIFASDSFIFSGNHVKKMENPFNVSTTNAQIVGNTFEKTSASWLSNIIITSGNELGIFNMSYNIVDVVTKNFFAMHPQGEVDFIIFKNNSFNCTCRYIGSQKNILNNFLLQKGSGNVCFNLDNCDLYIVLKNIEKACLKSFICSEAEETSEKTVLSYLDRILTELRSIGNTLNSSETQHKSAPSNSTKTNFEFI